MNRHQRPLQFLLPFFSLILGSIALAVPGSALAAPLVTSITQNGTLVNTQPAIATSASSQLPQPAGAGTQGALGDEAYSYVTRTAEWTGARTTDATGLLTTSTAVGTTQQPFPSYLVGLEYLQVAQEHRTVADYSLNLTFSQPVKAYLFLDNRLNGTAGNNSNPNTAEPILTGNLAWVGADGWTRVNTGFMPPLASGAPQADFIGQDEGATVASADLRTHHDPGLGAGLNNFSAIFTKNFPAGANVGVAKAYGITNTNMYGLAFQGIPEPGTGLLAIFGACCLRAVRRRNRSV